MSERKDKLASGAKSFISLPSGDVESRAGVEETESNAHTEAKALVWIEAKLQEAFKNTPEELAMVADIMENIGETFDLSNEMAYGMAQKVIIDQVKVRRAMSDPGKLGLPHRLEHARWLEGITDGAFRMQPFHDRILVHQTPQWKGGTASKDGTIVLSKIGERRERESAPEGIIVAAGLQALDELRSNGIDLGHRVSILRQAPWRQIVDSVEGKEFYVLLLRTGDVTGSFTLAEDIRAGQVKVEYDAEAHQHYYVNEDGSQWRPAHVAPTIFVPEDY